MIRIGFSMFPVWSLDSIEGVPAMGTIFKGFCSLSCWYLSPIRWGILDVNGMGPSTVLDCVLDYTLAVVQSLSCVWLFGLQHARLSCPSLSPRVCSNSCPLSWWCHPTILSSVSPFSSCLQSFPASGSFPMSQFFVSGGQSIGASSSASVLPMNIQDWFPLGLTGLISLQSKGL